MSFNLLKFKKPEVKEVVNQELSVDFLIIGFDAKTMFDLTSADNFLFLDQNERTIPENLKLIDNLPYPWIFNTGVVEQTKFYKDGEFRSFSGRHKMNNCHPYLLKFMHTQHPGSWLQWWDEKLSNDVKNKFNESLLIGQVKSLFYKNNSWEVHTFDHKIIKSPKIKWNLSPELFLKLFRYEEQYPKNFLTWSSTFKPLNFLLLQFNIPEAQFATLSNALIPLTMGTDEGYFLLSKFESNTQDTNLNLLYVFDQADFQEEDVANKIRLIKKQMSKIYGITEKMLKNERVNFLPHFTHQAENHTESLTSFIQSEAIFNFDQQYFSHTPSELSAHYVKFAEATELTLPIMRSEEPVDQLTL